MTSHHTYSPPTSDPHIPDVRNCGCAVCTDRNAVLIQGFEDIRQLNARLEADNERLAALNERLMKGDAQHERDLHVLLSRVDADALAIERLRVDNERLKYENRALQGDVMDSDHNELVQLRSQVDQQRRALIHIENWVGKEYADLNEAETIREYIGHECEKALPPL